MKKLKVMGLSMIIILGIALLFTATIMFDTDTEYLATAFMILLLGITLTISGIGFIAYSWEDL